MSFYHNNDGSVVPILSTNGSEDALRKRRNNSLKPFIQQQQQQIFIPDMIPQRSMVATASSHNLRKSTHSDVSMKPTGTTTSLQIWSHHVERIKLLLRHLFPNLMNRESTRMSENGFESTKKIETEDYYCSSNVKAFPSCCCCTYLLLVGNTGDMSACSDLSICNAIKDYSHNFEKYSRCIINVHNDLFHFLYFVKNVEKMYGDKLDVMDLTYNMICNYEYQKTKELMKFFNGKNYERSLKCMKEHSVLSLNIIYWSGHGENNLGLSFPSFQYMSFEEFLSIFANQNSESISIPHLFVMECCFSNEKEIFNFVQKTRHHNKPFPYLFLCSSIEKSGGWICDGVDSNGIMTNFLTDPVSSFFKVKYKIFFDLGNNSSEYFPYFNAKVKRKFYSIIDTCLSEVFPLVYPVEFVNFIGAHLSFLHSSMIRLLFKHFILLHYYVDKLYQRQTPFSYPPISTHVLRDLKVVTLFSQMEDNIDSLLIDTFRNTQI
ncbi:hypothetical protein C9374_008575 [Naegleria lovaniensis]|uniref:Uncharacterized protein n=1 Tax=Naegleria lovaniensis TaxID=51637 RepID=A0AA88KHL4_NAELO|nr:uncharacterized protein C9374_008575 [Naegleria lovaniensis]KAG2377953.1 hypothetical protein C9374_008575 [Naegleria lovaniensis]